MTTDLFRGDDGREGAGASASPKPALALRAEPASGLVASRFDPARKETVPVPCNGCTACCQNDMIMLHPELGDDPTQYETEAAINPITGKVGRMLAKRPDGACVYLTDGVGCTIHGRAPAICREFDCRRMFMKIGASQAAKAIAAGLLSQSVVDAGRKRRRTLEAA